MAFYQEGDLLQVKTYCRLGSQLGIMTRHWYVEDAPTPDDLTDVLVADELLGLLDTTLPACMASEAIFQGFTVQRIKPTLGLPYLRAVAENGTGTGGAMAPQVSGLITFKTAMGGRSQIGRNFVPFPAESHNDPDGTPADVYITSLELLGNSLRAQLNIVIGGQTYTLNPVLVNREPPIVTSLILTDKARFLWSQRTSRSFLRRSDSGPFD